MRCMEESVADKNFSFVLNSSRRKFPFNFSESYLSCPEKGVKGDLRYYTLTSTRGEHSLIKVTGSNTEAFT